MRVIVGSQFAKDARRLSESVQKKLALQINICAHNPFDIRLHTKPLSGSFQGLFSFRIGRDYRALFRFIDPATLFLARVAHRSDIYR
ncbi:hypothetical protein HY415_00230 [Candidatus Kaiserbacteria bacterium]|nr:hypothetical protein [Candidatus Kaiserbacteria bacterium]